MTTASPSRTYEVTAPDLVAPARYQARPAYVAPTDFEVEALAEQLNQSTGASWLWALLFGPFYFAAHGLWIWALVALLIGMVTAPFFGIGAVLFPFLVYPAWRREARKRAQKLLNTQAIYQASANVRS